MRTAAAIRLRPPSRAAPEIIAIGSSTGGPQALFSLLPDLIGWVAQPILIVQHMPASFTGFLARQIGRLTGVVCAEARHGEPIRQGRIYLAPGNLHMRVARTPEGPGVGLGEGPPENYCRPALDALLCSAVEAYGAGVLAVILTGMGRDGFRGSEAVVRAGGTVIAQDEASSVVWGMPGAVARAGMCAAVLPLSDIGSCVRRLAVRPAA